VKGRVSDAALASAEAWAMVWESEKVSA